MTKSPTAPAALSEAIERAETEIKCGNLPYPQVAIRRADIRAILDQLATEAARAREAKDSEEILRLAILGGEDAPGHAASLPLAVVVGVHHENVTTARERAETAEARADAAELESADLTKALTGLTCGGSEFFVRRGDRYTADIAHCVEYIGRIRQSQHETIVRETLARKAATTRLRAISEAAAMTLVALGPFAELAAPRHGVATEPSWIDWMTSRGEFDELSLTTTVGTSRHEERLFADNFRAARTAHQALTSALSDQSKEERT